MENKSSFAKFIDNFVYCICIIVFSIVWCGYIIKRLVSQIIIGSLAGILLYLILFNTLNKLTNKKKLKQKDEKHKNECIYTLSLADPNKIYKFFSIMLCSKYTTKIEKPFILITNKDTNKLVFILSFNFFVQNYTLDLLYNVIEHTSKYKTNVLVFSKTFTPECYMITNKLQNICLLDANESYLFFKEFNTFPKITEKIKEKRFSNLKNNIFSSINIKRFFKTSLIVLILGILTPLRKYYLTISSILFILAIVCFFIQKPTTSKLDFHHYIFTKQED